MIDGKLPIYVCFPKCPSNKKQDAVDWFWEHCAYEGTMNIQDMYIHFISDIVFFFVQIGVLHSDQARTTPIALPYQSVVAVSPKGYSCRITSDTLQCIQGKINDLMNAAATE